MSDLTSADQVAERKAGLAPGRAAERDDASLADSKTFMWLARIAILVVLMSAWQFLPEIAWLRGKSPVFDPFFVSSPSRVVERLAQLFQGSDGQPKIWPYLWQTLRGTFFGVVIGTSLGALFGLVLSNSSRLQPILAPYIGFLNAMPRVALVPIFVIIAGASITTSVLTSVAVVFFIVFYNAYSGGRSVPAEMVENARLLGAGPGEIMRQVRLPYVLVWTFTALPNAISFGLVSVVTAEILMGSIGMGRLLFTSISSVDSTLTFSVVVLLSVVGVTAVTIADALQRRALHWWEGSR
jgi:NitT/TauT family transport system permease protein